MKRRLWLRRLDGRRGGWEAMSCAEAPIRDRNPQNRIAELKKQSKRSLSPGTAALKMQLSQRVSPGYSSAYKVFTWQKPPALLLAAGDTTRGRAHKSPLPGCCLCPPFMSMCSFRTGSSSWRHRVLSIAHHPVLDMKGCS